MWASAVGIEMNEEFYKEAMDNRDRYARKAQTVRGKFNSNVV